MVAVNTGRIDKNNRNGKIHWQQCILLPEVPGSALAGMQQDPLAAGAFYWQKCILLAEVPGSALAEIQQDPLAAGSTGSSAF